MQKEVQDVMQMSMTAELVDVFREAIVDYRRLLGVSLVGDAEEVFQRAIRAALDIAALGPHDPEPEEPEVLYGYESRP